MILDAITPFTDAMLLLAQQTSGDAPPWLERFMGLSQLRLGDADTVLGWRWALPAWLWVLVILAAAAVGMMSYRHLVGARLWRVSLGTLRAIIVIVIVALLAGPMLVLPRERVDRDWLIMLVDRSASMQIRDMPPEAPPEVVPREAGATSSSTQPAIAPSNDDANLSRDEVLAEALRRRQDLFGPDQIGQQKHVLWLGFDSSAYPLGGPGALGEADGQATAIRSAIQQALQRAAGQPISAMVLITDGRSSEATTGQLVHDLNRQAVSVIAIPLGSEQGQLDLAIRQVTAPDRAFIEDPVPVSVQIDRFPADAPLLPGQVTITLTDATTGEVLDEKQPAIEALDGPITLTGKSGRAGPGQWRVQVIYQPPMQAPGEASTQPPRELLVENNLRDFEIELVDRQLRVLYVEGYPRWDYRYIKNMLLREKSVLSSVLILSADPGFVQEGTLPITRFPSTMAELEPYDMLIIGDVPAGYFSATQLQMIQDHVATTGAGLLWIGGPRDTPVSYQGTPLADLLPMLSPASVSRLDVRLAPVRLSPAPLAQALQVLELNPESAMAAQTLWQETLAPLWYMQDVGALKPTAEMLAIASPASQSASADDVMPAMLRLRFGAGQSVYVATDETWRYRFGRGEIYFERFWTQLIRMLARGRLAQDQGSITLASSTRRAQLDEPVVITAHVKDDALAQLLSGRLKVEVTSASADESDASSAAGSSVLETIELQPLPADAADRQSGRRYQATWRPGSTGRLTLRLADASLSQMGITRAIEVIRPDDELRQPLPDLARLEALAAQTQGHVLALEELRKLPTLLPNRAQRTPDDLREPLWNSALALTLVILLLTLEWIGRKLIRLA